MNYAKALAASALDTVADDLDRLGAAFSATVNLLIALADRDEPMAAISERSQLARHISNVRSIRS